MPPGSRDPAKAMRVIRLVPRVVYDRVVLLETDDGFEAEAFVEDWCAKDRGRTSYEQHPHVEGVHVSHTAPDERGYCTACAKPLNNGCFASHLPCGHKDQRPMATQIQEWREAKL